jgi:RimJ/RimL family protein N-acetyltransferase
MPEHTLMDPTYSLRRLSGHDTNAYRELRLGALTSDPTSFAASFEDEADQPPPWFTQRLENHAIFGGYRTEGLLAGVAGLMIQHASKQRHKGVLWGMFVRPEDRGTGLAAALVECVLEHARDVVEEIRLTVVATNTPAVRLYERLGFKQYGLEPRGLKFEGRYYDEVLMAMSAPRAV